MPAVMNLGDVALAEDDGARLGRPRALPGRAPGRGTDVAHLGIGKYGRRLFDLAGERPRLVGPGRCVGWQHGAGRELGR